MHLIHIRHHTTSGRSNGNLKSSKSTQKKIVMSSRRPKILVTRNDVPKKALDKLKETCDVEIFPELYPIKKDQLLKAIRGKDGLFCLLTDKVDKDVLDAAGPTLKVISTMSVGYDHLDITEMKARNIKVGYTPGVLTEATAELTVALLLATSRRLLEAHKDILSGGWNNVTWSPLYMTGFGLSKSTVGIFGLGRIGQCVLKMLKGFNASKFIYNSRSEKEEGKSLGAEYVPFDSLLRESDFLIITAALNPETKGIFNTEAFSKMKNSSILINISRGAVLDQDALVTALKTGQIRAAGLDVMTPEPLSPDHPLINTPNLTLLPHIGSAEISTREIMAHLTVNNILAALKGTEMPHRLC